jgi:hypothetical protein
MKFKKYSAVAFLVMVMAMTPSVRAQDSPPTCNRPVHTVLVPVGECPRAGMTSPNSSSNPPRAISEEERQFKSYDEALKFSEEGFAKNQSLLGRKYCDEGKSVTQHGKTAVCSGNAWGSYGVFGDNRSKGYYRIYGLACQSSIECDIPDPDPAVRLSARAYRDWIDQSKKKCVAQFTGKADSSTPSKTALPDRSKVVEAQGCAEPAQTIMVKVGDCFSKSLPRKIPIVSGQKRFGTYKEAFKYAEDAYHAAEIGLTKQYCSLDRKFEKAGIKASCHGGTAGMLGVGWDDRTLGQFSISELNCDFQIPCEVHLPRGQKGRRSMADEAKYYDALKKQTAACKMDFLSRQVGTGIKKTGTKLDHPAQ